MTTEIIKAEQMKGEGLQLGYIQINEDYRKKWNIHGNDFFFICKDGQPLRHTLYRKGGLGANIKDDYFALLKYTEDIYPDSITTVKKDKKHLKHEWCIIDKWGNEKVVIEQFKHPYIVRNSCIYSVDRHYYNIETGEYYGQASTSMESDDFVFLENRWDKDKSKCGVLKINKLNGTVELFPLSRS